MYFIYIHNYNIHYKILSVVFMELGQTGVVPL